MALPVEFVLNGLFCRGKRRYGIFVGLDGTADLGFELIRGLGNLAAGNQLGGRIELLEMLTEGFIVAFCTSLCTQGSGRKQGLADGYGYFVQ